MAIMQMVMEHGTVKFVPTTRLTQDMIDQLPADVRIFLVERTKEHHERAKKEDLFEVTITGYIKEQVENLWSSSLARAFRTRYGDEVWAAVEEFTLKDTDDNGLTATIGSLDIYFYLTKPLTSNTIRVYASNAIEAGERALALLTGLEAARVTHVALLTNKRK